MGAVAGVALQNKTTPLFLLAAVTVGVLLVGPRRGAAVALAVAGRVARVGALVAEPGLAGCARLPAARTLPGDRRRQLRHQRAVVRLSAVPGSAGKPGARAGVGGRLVAAGPRPRAADVAGVRRRLPAARRPLHGYRREAVLPRRPVPRPARRRRGAGRAVGRRPGTAHPDCTAGRGAAGEPGRLGADRAAGGAGRRARGNPGTRPVLRRGRDGRMAGVRGHRRRCPAADPGRASGSPSWPQTTGRPAPSTGSCRTSHRPTAGTTPTGPGARRPTTRAR